MPTQAYASVILKMPSVIERNKLLWTLFQHFYLPLIQNKFTKKSMKKFILLLSLFFAMQSFVFGQISLRPQVGINFASFSNDLLDTAWSSNVAYQFGADLQIGGAFYVQPGINYQSTKLTFEGAEDIDFTTSRLNIPVFVGFRLFEQEDATFGIRAFAGPNLALHIGEDFDTAIDGLSGDDFETAHWSGLIGGGLDISILFIDVAYKFGLTDYIDIEDLQEDTNKNIFIANAGIRIGF